MKFSENRPLAVALTVLVMALTLVLGGARGLNQLKDSASDVFYRGVTGDGLCIWRDLSARGEAAYNLESIATKYLKADDAQLLAAGQAREALAAEQSIAGQYEKNAQLTQAVEDLYTALENAPLSESDRSFAYKQYKEFKSRADTILNDPYNQWAEDFNRQLSGQPAALIARLTGIAPLELFR